MNHGRVTRVLCPAKVAVWYSRKNTFGAFEPICPSCVTFASQGRKKHPEGIVIDSLFFVSLPILFWARARECKDGFKKMPQPPMEEHITKMLEDLFAADESFADCYVVEVNQTNTRLEIFVDADSGMTFRKCQQMSRHVEAYLDEEQPLGEKYTLNVSSPGVDRPLKFQRQYVKNVGRNMKVKTTAGEEHEGKMIAAEDDAITLEAKVRIKEGKRKKTVVQQTKIAYADISKAIVKISF